MIEAKNITKAFGEHQVLKGIDASFEAGQCNLIIGRSGSGKTVFLKCMVGLFKPDTGSVNFSGKDLVRMTAREKLALRKEIGMLFQGNALFDSLTVFENVKFPLDMFTDMSLSEKNDRVAFCLSRVNLTGAENKYPGEISGGMMKRVGIARAIVQNPKYLFCDEPNSGLDPKTALVIDDLIREITQEYNMTTIINTHDMNSVMGIGDKVVYLANGYKVWEGNKAEIMETDNEDLYDFIFASDFLKDLQKTAAKNSKK